MTFNNKTIIVGVTGGIAAYKTADLVSKLRQSGADVWVVMTKEAAKLVTPLTFRTLSGNPVVADLFEKKISKLHVPHISLAKMADLIIVAPCTANLLGKIVHGISDDALTTTLMASHAPKLLAPAMNKDMWDNSMVKRNVKLLKKEEYCFAGPEVGFLACGDTGTGRMVDVSTIIKNAEDILSKGKDLKGKRILVTAGGTREALDPVRFIGNRSSGKMGYAIAQSALDRGANVTLISAPTSLKKPKCKIVNITTAEQMAKAVRKEFKSNEVLIMAAAVADYSPILIARQKIKKTGAVLEVKLKRTTDILKEVGQKKGKKVVIGFALETNNMIANAKKKMKEKNLDYVIANTTSAFDSNDNDVKIISSKGKIVAVKGNKGKVADTILDLVR
jgi:phosphopantothenoylcysteine decarboxylase / phosphopantothenate---cysteine ligase